MTLPVEHRIVRFRSEYFRLDAKLNQVVPAMIYPVPEPGLPFLGIHLTPMIDGSVSMGPNAILGLTREGYAKGSIDLRDVFDTLSSPGFLGGDIQEHGSGLIELTNTLFKSRYLAECRRYCPSLELGDLTPMEPGIRAQAVMRDGDDAARLPHAEYGTHASRLQRSVSSSNFCVSDAR